MKEASVGRTTMSRASIRLMIITNIVMADAKKRWNCIFVSLITIIFRLFIKRKHFKIQVLFVSFDDDACIPIILRDHALGEKNKERENQQS